MDKDTRALSLPLSLRLSLPFLEPRGLARRQKVDPLSPPTSDLRPPLKLKLKLKLKFGLKQAPIADSELLSGQFLHPSPPLWQQTPMHRPQPARGNCLRVACLQTRSFPSRSVPSSFVSRVPQLPRTVGPEAPSSLSSPPVGDRKVKRFLGPLAPSYFSRFFEEQLRFVDSSNVRTLYIDRDPATFQDIARHLQGVSTSHP